MSKQTLEPSERYLVVEALKRWRDLMEKLVTTDKTHYEEVLALIAKFEEGTL